MKIVWGYYSKSVLNGVSGKKKGDMVNYPLDCPLVNICVGSKTYNFYVKSKSIQFDDGRVGLSWVIGFKLFLKEFSTKNKLNDIWKFKYDSAL